MITVTFLGPVVSTFVCMFLSRYTNQNILKVVILLYILSSLSSIYLLYTIAANGLQLTLPLFNWSTLLGINMQFTLDLINASLLSVIMTVGTCVISYSVYYMAEDAHVTRFVGLLSGFVSFMAVLAVGSNLVVLFIGWELIGLFSYLLIGFWSDRTEASTAALGAMLTNKLGDYFLSFGLIVTFSQICTLDIDTLNTLYSYVSSSTTNSLIAILSISYIIASMAKSAQIGLHLWLIQAMQGPTPVSSLLHAATLVVAGPILLFKVTSIINYHVSLLVIIGIVTSLLGATLALIQQDIKGVIAYSTMSQFGYIISISGIAAQSVANLHITTHAAFKACLFMAAGVVIHSVYDIQDNRRYGALNHLLPIAYLGSLICSLSLIAIPYTAGALSKDLILEVHSSQYQLSHQFGFTIGCIVASLTALYSMRLLYITYGSSVNLPRVVYEKAHGANLYALVPISVLTIFAVILGYFGQPILLDAYGYTDSIIIAELWNISVKPIPVLLVFLGIALSILWVANNYNFSRNVYHALAHRLYWPKFNSGLYFSYLGLASKASKLVDLGVLETIGPHGVSNLLRK